MFRNSSIKMAANKLRLSCFKFLPSYISNSSLKLSRKAFYCTNKTDEEKTSSSVSKFAEFYKKELELQKDVTVDAKPKKSTETFASLLRNSKFVDLGDPEGKEVVGTIVHVVGNDLYIDFGWKFLTVCPIPKNNNKFYVKGRKVRLLIKELELSTKFLGANVETSLLEADCVLLGLYREKS